MKKLSGALLSLLLAASAAAAPTQLKLTSPDGKINVDINAGKELSYTVSYDGKQVIGPSAASMTLSDGTTVGVDLPFKGSTRTSVNETIQAPVYRSREVKEAYNQLTLNYGKDWEVQFRAYDDGVAYRFVAKGKKPFQVVNEQVEYSFSPQSKSYVPRVRDGITFEEQFVNNHQNFYTVGPLSAMDPARLAFVPVLVKENGVNVAISESDLQGYPGMYLYNPGADGTLKSMFAPYPKEVEQGGWHNLQQVVKSRENYIARADGARTFPWRIAVVSPTDKGIAESNLTWLLGAAPRLKDTSWIKPGKVAWDWWNDWNLYGVDFEAGINNETYKYYIDFAADKGIEYVILDEGWAVENEADLMKVIPEINLKELVNYGKEKGVGIILWAGYKAFDRDMEAVCKHYADMGVKGFKIDFMDRDDALLNDFLYRSAETCARYGLLADFHGCAKPAGLNRTWANVINFEGVNGLEQMKWCPDSLDQVEYDVTLPFTRQVAGPMDYTQGAMRNAAKESFRAIDKEPMSQGTRCRQLALYMVLDSPLNMLCDSPSNYLREEECTDFIAAVPTVWDETRVLDAAIGDMIVTARRDGSTWWVGGLTDWTPRELTVDFNELGVAPGTEITLFTDGPNAAKAGRDYKKQTVKVPADGVLKVKAAPGGGFALKTGR